MTAKIKLHFWNQHKKLRWLRKKKNYTRNYQNNTLTTKKSHKSAKIDTFEQKKMYRRFNAIVSQLKISLFWVIYIIQKPRYCCVGRRKLVTLHALFGN